MKIEFNENEYGIDVTLVPESVDEMAALLRYANNAAKVKPDVWMSFSREPYLSVHLTKLKPSVQKNSIH